MLRVGECSGKESAQEWGVLRNRKFSGTGNALGEGNAQGCAVLRDMAVLWDRGVLRDGEFSAIGSAQAPGVLRDRECSWRRSAQEWVRSGMGSAQGL